MHYYLSKGMGKGQKSFLFKKNPKVKFLYVKFVLLRTFYAYIYDISATMLLEIKTDN